MIKFGITERGDVAFTNDWMAKIQSGEVAAAVIISKGMPLPEGRRFMLENGHKLIFHATTTGMGGSIVEPHVKKYQERLDEVAAFVREGFPISHIVVRVDPIVPTAKGINLAKSVVDYAWKLGFKRFRYSWMDCYSHVVARFSKIGVDIRSAVNGKEVGKASWMDFCDTMELYDCTFESCAEQNKHFCGCISAKDFTLCGLDTNEIAGKCRQRATCGCVGNKVELLDAHPRGRCPFQCVYCYWI